MLRTTATASNAPRALRRSLSSTRLKFSHRRVLLAPSCRATIDPGLPPRYTSVSGRRTLAFDYTARAMSAVDERRWNRMADHMSAFHNHFKVEFNELYELADGSFNKRGMNLRQYLRKADELCRHLTMHHTIEERHVFPLLAKKMPEFRANEAHIKSHHGIHKGLDALSALTQKWKAEPKEYDPGEMKECLDSWREVLFKHLDEEVRDLSAENMKKYWTLQEMDRLPM